MEKALRETLVGGQFKNVPATHSRRMKAIRERGNKSTEARFRAMLIRAGIRGWRMHPKGLAGKPDFFFPDDRVTIFIDGCFWHGCPQCGHLPRVNSRYWKVKIARNQQRDRVNTQQLQESGISVLRIWEHELQAGAKQCIERLKAALPASDMK